MYRDMTNTTPLHNAAENGHNSIISGLGVGNFFAGSPSMPSRPLLSSLTGKYGDNKMGFDVAKTETMEYPKIFMH